MRILRIRRGYTTNSSGANEWVPSPDGGYWRQSTTPPPQQSPDAGPRTSSTEGWRGLGPLSPADASAARAAASAPGRPAQDGSVATPARRDKTAQNCGDIGILTGVVILFIAGWGVVKAVLAKKSDG